MIAMDSEREKLISLLTENGATFRGNSCRCVFHDDKTPSAGVYQGKDGRWRFRCHVCDIQGDYLDIQSRLTGKPLGELLPKSNTGQPKRRTEPKKPDRVFPSLDDLCKTLRGTVVGRYPYPDGLLQIRYVPPGEKKQYVSVHETPRGWVFGAPPTKPRRLYHEEKLKDATEVFFVEGEPKVETLESMNLTATCNPFGAGKASLCDLRPLSGKKIILWADSDTAGRNHMKDVREILERLEPRPDISEIEPNDLGLMEKQDVVDFCEQNGYGPDEVKLIQNAIRKCRPSGGLRNLLEETISGRRQAISTPWRLLDILTLSLQPEAVLMLCGGVGASKSFMLLQAGSFWLDHGIPFAIFELEESREFHELRVLAQRSGIADLTNPEWVRENPEIVRQAYNDNADFMDAFSPNLYATPERQPTLQDLASWVEIQAKDGCRIICLDPVTAGLHTRRDSWSEDSEFLQRVKQTATKYLCSIILVTHPTKPGNGEPDLSLIAGSAAFTRFSQTVVWLQNHTNQKQSTVVTDCGPTDILHNRTLHVLKARYAKGQGLKIACHFTDGLELKTEGVIVKDKS